MASPVESLSSTFGVERWGRASLFFLTLILVLTVIPSLAESGVDEAVVSQMRQLVANGYASDEPGAAVIVVKDGEVLLREARGMANLELGIPLKPEMVFRLGSITKQFTAAAILLLQQQGKLSVTDEITKFLPDYPTHGHRITIEHLLTHSSGIYSYTGIPGYMTKGVRDDLSTTELVGVFKNLPMDFAPGEQWRYNNSGYVLLGAIIEKVSGQSYADFVNEQIFQPLGMNASHYGGQQLISNRVDGYSGSQGNYRNAPYLSMSQPHAAGSLLSTVDDLARWDAALATNELLSEDSYRAMTTRYKLNNGEEVDYGFGLGLSELRGRPSVAHGGGIFGFSTYALRLPGEKLYVAVLSNNPGYQPGPGMMARKLAAIAIGDPFPEWETVDVDESVLKRYEGVYRIDDQHQRVVRVQDGKLYTQRDGGRLSEALPASETRFFYPDSLSWFDLILDEQGQVKSMQMHSDGDDEFDEAEWVGKEPEPEPADTPTESTYQRFVGVYQLAPTFEIAITSEGDRLFGQATGQPRFELFAESENVFYLKAVEAKITFVLEDDGQMNQLILHQGGRDVPGKRVR